MDDEGPDMTKSDWHRAIGVLSVIVAIAIIFLVGMWLG